jgi:hypothetical protein
MKQGRGIVVVLEAILLSCYVIFTGWPSGLVDTCLGRSVFYIELVAFYIDIIW